MLSQLKVVELALKNFIPRGSIIHNTPHIIGIVLYVGKDTKINQNMRKLNFKQSWLIQDMNRYIYSLFVF